MTEQDDLASGQAHAEALIARLESDANFAELAATDPRGALTEVGVPAEEIDSVLTALDPQHVLARGYAWLSDERGQPVLSVTQIELGSPLKARLADGTVRVAVTGVDTVPRP